MSNNNRLTDVLRLSVLSMVCIFISMHTLLAQSPINYVEYYVDQDPGFGKGIQVPVTAATTITDATFTVNVSALNKGIHILASRAKTASGVWSMGHYWFIFKPYDAIIPSSLSNITKVEYYIDKDPGLGLGTSVNIATPATDLSNMTFSFNPTNLSKGVHIVGCRALDANGKWSATNYWMFVNPFSTISSSATTNITNVEYYVDQDPGIGLATSVNITPANDISNNTFTTAISSLSSGTHFIGVRAKDANGSWSSTNNWLFVKPFTNITPAALQNITSFEYYLDYDLGYGKCTPVSITAGTNLADINFNVDLTGVVPGTHHVVARAKDAKGNWSMVNNWEFTVPGTAPTITTIVSTTTLCAGSQINVGYQCSSSISLKTTNQYIAQISDEYGVFTDPRTIGTYTSGSSNTASFTCTLPKNLKEGSGYRIRVVTTNQSVVADDNGTNITIYSLPEKPKMISPSADTTYCKYNQLNLVSSNTSYGSYQWLLNNNPISGANSDIYKVTNVSSADAGTYTLRVSNYSSSTCYTLSSPIVVSVNSNVPSIPVLSPSGAIGVCLGNSAILSTTTATNYKWYKDGQPISGANSQTYNANNAGTYTVRISNGNACYIESSNNAVISLGLAATKPTIVPGGSTNFCQGSSVLLTSSAFTGNQWYLNGVAVAGQTASTVYASQSGYYYSVITGGGCSINSDSVNIIVNPYVTPSVALAVSGNNVPLGTSITFTATATNGGAIPKYAFYVSGVLVQNSFDNTYTSNTLANGAPVYCVITSDAACVSPLTASSNTITVTYSPPVVIAGRVYHPSNVPIPFVKVKVTGGIIDSTINDGFGKYSFSLNQQLNYSISPFKNNDVNKVNGVNVLDVVKMQSHILNASLLNNPYKVIAADVNGDGVVSVIDVVLVKRLILGMDTIFNGRLWAFVDSSATFTNSNNPFPYLSSKNYNNLSAAQSNQSFIGVKLGDVTMDWTPTIGLSKMVDKKNSVKLYYDPAFVEMNNQIRLKVRVKDFKQIVGLQFGLAFNSDAFTFVSIENKQLQVEENTNHSDKGIISFIWADQQSAAKTLSDGSYIFDIILAKNKSFDIQDLNLNNEVISCVAYNKNFEPLSVTKLVGSISDKIKMPIAEIGDERLETYPNPSNGNLNLNIYAKTSKRIDVVLFDSKGNIVFKKNADIQEGKNQLQLNLTKQKLVATGVYYLKTLGIDAIPIKEIIINKGN